MRHKTKFLTHFPFIYGSREFKTQTWKHSAVIPPRQRGTWCDKWRLWRKEQQPAAGCGRNRDEGRLLEDVTCGQDLQKWSIPKAPGRRLQAQRFLTQWPHGRGSHENRIYDVKDKIQRYHEIKNYTHTNMSFLVIPENNFRTEAAIMNKFGSMLYEEWSNWGSAVWRTRDTTMSQNSKVWENRSKGVASFGAKAFGNAGPFFHDVHFLWIFIVSWFAQGKKKFFKYLNDYVLVEEDYCKFSTTPDVKQGWSDRYFRAANSSAQLDNTHSNCRPGR